MRDYNDEFVADVFKVFDEYNYITVEKDMECFIFVIKPSLLDNHFSWNGNKYQYLGKVNLNGQDWRTTLRERPKVVWVPNIGDMYYVPDVISRSKYDSSDWSNDSHDRYRLERGLVNQTPEQAIAMTDKILEFVKNLNEGK